MIEQSDRLMKADLLVHQEKRAGLVGEIAEGATGLWRATGKATKGIAKELAPFGVPGKVIGLGVRAAPTVAVLGGTNYLLGDPAGKMMRAKLNEFRARRAMQQAVYDPQTGMMY